MVVIGDDTARSKDVEARLIKAHEAERRRIARELHDDIGQRMAVLTLDLDARAQALPLPTDVAAPPMPRIRQLVLSRTAWMWSPSSTRNARTNPAR